MKVEDIVNVLLKKINMEGEEFNIDSRAIDDYTTNITISKGSMEYNIFNESQRHMEATVYILETVEYFNPNFLSLHTGLDEDVFVGVSELKRANALVTALIKGTCGITEFVNEAVDTDGYGHFLSPYDGEEIELDVIDGWDTVKYYAYRVN